jgi:hypothetical protein
VTKHLVCQSALNLTGCLLALGFGHDRC